jgi:hypothetical protein
MPLAITGPVDVDGAYESRGVARCSPRCMLSCPSIAPERHHRGACAPERPGCRREIRHWQWTGLCRGSGRHGVRGRRTFRRACAWRRHGGVADATGRGVGKSGEGARARWHGGRRVVGSCRLQAAPPLLLTLVPPPRYPLVQYHGVFAPHAKRRRAVVPRRQRTPYAGLVGTGAALAEKEGRTPALEKGGAGQKAKERGLETSEVRSEGGTPAPRPSSPVHGPFDAATEDQAGQGRLTRLLSRRRGRVPACHDGTPERATGRRLAGFVPGWRPLTPQGFAARRGPTGAMERKNLPELRKGLRDWQGLRSP